MQNLFDVKKRIISASFSLYKKNVVNSLNIEIFMYIL